MRAHLILEMVCRFDRLPSCSTKTISFVVIFLAWGAVIQFGSGSGQKSTRGAKFKELNSFYENNEIQVGDLFETLTKLEMVAVETNQVILIPKACPLKSVFRLKRIDLPMKKSRKFSVKVRKLSPNLGSGYDRHRVVAVLKRLQDKALRHQNFSCNRCHWRDYILYGKTHKTCWFKSGCPLAKPILGVSPEKIMNGEFTFEDSHGPVNILTWESYQKLYGPGTEHLDCGCCGPVCGGKDYHPDGKCIFAD
ncbi:uncharacterized protein [Bemisia tabaci]|uniref:uncharacterized protein n=1 Tax=Bemisia tabaci TaxID=7038 RepID=UPI003B27CF15